jgi:hypothetical protein
MARRIVQGSDHTSSRGQPHGYRITSRAIEVFESYSHPDQRIRGELDKHLASLKRSDVIRTWHDARIIPGSEIGLEIITHLRRADLVLLLVSADFLASDYCYCQEMREAMQRHEAGAAIVIPIILRPVEWHDTPFGKLLALPRDGKPVTTWPKRDLAYVDIVKGIKRAIEALHERASQKV